MFAPSSSAGLTGTRSDCQDDAQNDAPLVDLDELRLDLSRASRRLAEVLAAADGPDGLPVPVIDAALRGRNLAQLAYQRAYDATRSLLGNLSPAVAEAAFDLPHAPTCADNSAVETLGDSPTASPAQPTPRPARTHEDAPQSTIGAAPAWQAATVEDMHLGDCAAALELLGRGLRSAIAGWRKVAGRKPGYLEHGSGIVAPSSRGGVTPIRGPLADCLTGRWLVWQCEDGHQSSQWMGCMRLDCSRCAPSVATQRSSRVWADCKDLTDTWGVAVLTVPQELRNLVTLDLRSDLRRAAYETVERWMRKRISYDTRHHPHSPVEIGAAVWFHPVGSRYVCPRAEDARKAGEPLVDDPCASVRRKRTHEQADEGALRCPHCTRRLTSVDDEEWNPHWNVMLPLVGRRSADGRAVRLPHWHDERVGALTELRAMWSARLAVELGTRVDVTNAFWEYRRGPKHIRHALRYFARSFPGWSHWTSTAGGNRYGALANRRVGALRESVREHIGLVERPPDIQLCECGKHKNLVGMTSSMAWRFLAGGVVPPDVPGRWLVPRVSYDALFLGQTGTRPVDSPDNRVSYDTMEDP